MARRSVYERLGQSQIDGSDQSARRHTVVQGETAASIAALEFGTGEFNSEEWRQLLEAQTPPIDDIDTLTVGMVLVIPSIQPTTD